MAHKKPHNAKYFVTRLGSLRKERQSFIAHYQELSEFIQPRRGRFLTSDRNVGGPRHSSIINSRATQAHRTARAGLFAGVMSPARPWFALRVKDKDLMEFAPVKVWLATVERLLREMFDGSNLYNMAPVMLGDLLLFGTSCMTHVNDQKDVARFFTHPVGSYMIGQNSRFEVTTLAREYEMTTEQLIGSFGTKAVSHLVKTQYSNGDLDNWHKVVQFIEPNPNADPTKEGNRFKPFRSVKYEPNNINTGGEKGKFLSESGFDRFPAYVPRWDLTGEDIYGTDCPAMTSLGDIKGLQIEERRKAQGIDKMVNPPLVGPASIKNVPVSSLPGGGTFYDIGTGTQKLEPLYTVKPELQALIQDIERGERRIDDSFFVNLFFAITNMQGIQPKNQLELLQRNEERLLQLGPPLGRVHGEFLEGMLDRSFDQMVERGRIPEAPDEIQGQELQIEFISSLAMAQRAVATGSIERLTGFVGGLKELGYEEILDKYDADQAVDEYSSLIGVPPRLVVPDSTVAEVRQKREAERQQQIAAEQKAQAAAQMKDEAAAVGALNQVGGQ